MSIKNINLDNKKIISTLINQVKQYESKILQYFQLNEIAVESMSNSGRTYCLPRESNNTIIILFYNINNNDTNTTSYYSVYFPLNNLSLPINSIQFDTIDVSAMKKIYEGSIFIGTMVKNNCTNIFHIENCLSLYGKPYEVNTPFDIMYSKLSKLINSNDEIRYVGHDKFICNQLYKSEENQLVELIQSLQSIEIVHILFINSNLNCIYVYNVKYNDRIKLPMYMDMYMYKTSITEIYNLIDMKNTSYGNAHIPSIEHSKMCKEWFKNISIDDYLLVKCKSSPMGFIPYKIKE